MGICSHTGTTDCGNILNKMAITRPKIATTIQSSRNIIKNRKYLVRALIYFPVNSESDFP